MNDRDHGYNQGVKELAGAIALAYGSPQLVPPRLARVVRDFLNTRLRRPPLRVTYVVQRVDTEAGPG